MLSVSRDRMLLKSARHSTEIVERWKLHQVERTDFHPEAASRRWSNARMGYCQHRAGMSIEPVAMLLAGNVLH